MNISIQDITNSIKSKTLSFEEKALALFSYQSKDNAVYAEWLKYLNRDYSVREMGEISFLPISIFKLRDVKTGEWKSEKYFLSSGTTASNRSKHHIRDEKWYHSIAKEIWEGTFEPLKHYEFLALLPHYTDNPSSSLLSMVDYFMSCGRNQIPSYFHENEQTLFDHLEKNKLENIPTVLFGVSFALLGYGEKYLHNGLTNTIVIETGGMKKFRREVTRSELHEQLRLTFEGAVICSEYGMTECTSQLYSTSDGTFPMNDMMHVVISDPSNPFEILAKGSRGRINIIDLGNIHSFAFIATDDLGMINENNEVEILGRIDSCELRGCNYLR